MWTNFWRASSQTVVDSGWMEQTVIIIDDDNDDTEIFCEALSEVRGDIVCLPMSNGKTAVDFFDSSSERNLMAIFLDVNMPVMNGWEILAKLKAIPLISTVPVIMYSNSSNPSDIQRSKKMGAAYFFIKSFNYHHLKKGLSTVIAHIEKGTLNEIESP